MGITNILKNLLSSKIEGAQEPKRLLELSMKDEDLIREIDNDVRVSKPLYDKIKRIQDENEQYYLGEQLDRKRFEYELPTAENLLYMATETIMAIICSQRREPIVLPGTDTDESRDLAEKTQTWLSWKWGDEDMVLKFEDWVRAAMISKIGVFKVRYDQFKDDFEIKTLKSQRIMIDKDATDEDNAKFIIEFKEDTMADLIALYPKAKEPLIAQYGKEQGTIIRYLEYWTNEFTVWKVGSILLDKKKNPNWNWEENREENLKTLKEKWASKVKNEKLENILLNYFDKPQKPYIILSLKNLGNSIYADSVTPDTPIIIRRYGKFLDIIPIEELAPAYSKNYLGYWEKYRHVDQNIEVVTKEGNWSKIAYIYRHKVNKPVYIVEIAGGIAKVTGDHSLFQSGKEIKVKDLKLKDKIDVLDFNFQNNYSEITKEYAYVLGFFVAEGWANGVKNGYRNNDWSISQKNSKVLEELGVILEKVWNQSFVVKKKPKGMFELKSIGKKEELVNWFRKHCYTKSGEKRVPIQILNSDKTIKRAFLDGYWNGDGSGNIKEKVARCTTKSFVLASGISYLLNCLGYEVGVYSDKVKKSIFNLNIIRTTRRKEKNEVKHISQKNNNDFVYDIETVDESHSFVGGVGNIIFHNTTDFEQGKVIQDIINRRKRLIDKAAVKALGREVVSGSFISKEEAKKMLVSPNSPLWLKGGKASDAITYVSPQPASPVLFDDLMESQRALDNVMGTHGTTRGERGAQETATGRTILRQGDYGRIDLTVKRINKKLELLYGWMLQMAKVYYNETHYVKMLGKEGAIEYLKFSSDAIEDGQEIRIKSELTVDKAAEKEAIAGQMQAGLLDPLSYFEAMDENKPKEKARKVILYKLDPKLYLSEYLVDANTPGMENTPEGMAMQEQSKIIKGEQVPPYIKADNVHIETHNKFIQSTEFKNVDDEIKMNMADHLRAEMEIVKQSVPNNSNNPINQQPQPQS